jgi:hypothetical protein
MGNSFDERWKNDDEPGLREIDNLFLDSQVSIVTKGRRLGSFTLTEVYFFFFIKHHFNAFVGLPLYISMGMIAEGLSRA